MLFTEIAVARFEVLTSVLMKIRMLHRVDWIIVTGVSKERISFIFRVKQSKNSAHCSWVEDLYFLNSRTLVPES
jgi:hypothetical protein